MIRLYLIDLSRLIHVYGPGIAFASLESLGQDKTFKSLESLVRLFQKVSKLIIL